MIEKNALPLLKEALEEKIVQVKLPGENKMRRLCLVKISGGNNFKKELELCYPEKSNKEIEKQLKLLEKVEQKEALNSYGTFIDPETLEIPFAFNMAFADFYRKANKLVRFPLENMLPVKIPEYYGKPCRDGEPCFGGRARNLVKKLGYFPKEEVVNCLPFFRGTMEEHKVRVTLPGEDSPYNLCLIKVWAKTSLKEDMKICYPGSSEFESPSMGPKNNTPYGFREYGLFIHPVSMKLFFAFNTDFAYYDPTFKSLRYLPTRREAAASYRRIAEENMPHRHHGGLHGVFMYALTEPRN